ncbi:MAG: hypothetical protein U0075_14790 [Thermomicrobiales bacterium]
MDARHFDALTRVLSTPDSRRRLLALLATLPLLGEALALFAPEDAAAKERRRRRKQRHKRRKRGQSGLQAEEQGHGLRRPVRASEEPPDLPARRWTVAVATAPGL